jgi:hypothetical protein
MRGLRRRARRLTSIPILHVPAGLLDRLEDEGRRWCPDETGGMLAGYRASDGAEADVVITDTIPAGPKASRTRTRFVPDGPW